MRSLRFVRAPVLAAPLALAAVGCPTPTAPEPAANDPACSIPLCPSDPAYTSDQIDECNRILDGACGVAYRALLDCAEKNRACDSAGHTDNGAIASACADQSSAYDQCSPGLLDASF
jgi:hypothetical protein